MLGSLYININPSEEASQWRRIKGQQILMPLQLAFSVLEVGFGYWQESLLRGISAATHELGSGFLWLSIACCM